MRNIFRFTGLLVALCVVQLATAQVGQVTFSYQGRVKVQGQPFNGSGQFKFAILNTSATVSLWSNDNTSVNGSQPTASVNLGVTDGIFDVIVGDPALGMASINPTIFQSQTPLKLRIWFNDGTHGFQELNPDHNLVNVALTTLNTGSQDFTIYVNGTTGNDANNGLTLTTAKKTIQAAVDVVPDRVRCNVTIRIAAGDYKETVRIYGISSSGTPYGNGDVIFDGKCLRLVGDETWTTTSVGNPSVRIMGADSDAPAAPKVRLYCVSAHNSTAISFEGLWFDKAGSVGAKLETGSYIFKNCQMSNCGFSGLGAVQGSFVSLQGCEAFANQNGFYVFEGILYVLGTYSHNNTAGGIALQGPALAHFYAGTVCNDNTWAGVACGDGGVVQFASNSLQAHGNGRFGVEVNTDGISHNTAAQDLTGNTMGAVGSSPGGNIY